MKRKHKLYAKPKKSYDSARISAENKLVAKYGLKNKREIWKAEARVNYYRSRAKSLITADRDVQQAFFAKLNLIGLNVNSIADILALTKEDFLKRRLSTIVSGKGLADTPKQARQMIAHKRILVAGKIVNSPSYLVKVEEETDIKVKEKKKVKIEKKEEAVEEKKEESEPNEEEEK